MAALPQNSGCGPLPFPAHLIVSIFVDFIGYWWQLADGFMIIHIHNTHYTLTNAVAAVYMTDCMGFKILWLAASTQSHANDWLRLHSKWLAAAAWWRRRRPLGYPCSVVCVSVVHKCEPCKSGWTDRDAVWAVDSGGPSELCIGWGVRIPQGKGQFLLWGLYPHRKCTVTASASKTHRAQRAFGLSKRRHGTN